ncbi:MAG: hypothetical protein ABI551_22850, partial [Polyangiaceae bacterium]
TAAADPTPTEIENARKLFKQAEADEAAQRWDTALDELRRASAIKMTAGLRFHIALCENNLHRMAAALADYTAADLLSKAENNAEVEDAVRDPLADLRSRVPTLKLVPPADVGPNDLQVKVDGTVVSDLSEGLRLDPGTHTVEARSKGRGTFSKQLVLKERDVTTVQIQLPKLVARPGEPDSAIEAPPAETRSGKNNYLPAILATAGAVVLVGVGVGSFVVAGSAQSDAQDACTSGSSDCDSKKSTVHVWDTVALGSWIAAAGVTGLAVVLWADPPSKAKTIGSARSVRLGAGPGTLKLEGSF